MTDLSITTSTRLRVPVERIRWLEVFWGYFGDLFQINPNAPVIRAAAREYRHEFDADLDRDIAGLKPKKKTKEQTS